MDAFVHTLLPLSTAVSAAAAAGLWQGVLLACAVAAALSLLPGITARTRSSLWLAVFGVVILLHAAPVLSSASTVAGPAAHGTAWHLDSRWSLAVAALWLLLSLTRAAQLAYAGWSLHRLSRRAHVIDAPADCAALLEGCGRRVELCSSAEVDRPSVIGFFSPRVLLPEDLLGELSPGELRQVLLHELEHLRRRDDWTNLLQKCSLVLFPLNPALFWIERRLCAERELACDDGVLRITGARKAYATCLVNLAQHRLVRRGLLLALNAWERPSELARRVHRILDRSRCDLSPARSRVLAATLLLAVSAGSVLLSRAPAVVSFGPPASTLATASSAATVQSGPTAAMVQTTTRPGSFSATLVRAEMPVAVRTTMARSRRVRRRASPRESAIVAPATAWSPRLVLTRARTSQAGERLMFALPATQRLSYAAIPVGDGWLIFQL